MWQSIISDIQVHKCRLPYVQMGFKDVCNQLKVLARPDQINSTSKYKVQSAQFTQVMAYLHQEGGTHSSWLDE